MLRPCVDVVTGKILHHEERDAFTVIGNDLRAVVGKNLLKRKLGNLIAGTMSRNILSDGINLSFGIWSTTNVSDHLNILNLSASEWGKYLTPKSENGP